jgi:hypothetical protein
MTRIADLLDRDFSGPVEEFIKIDNDDPETVFAELTEYVATDRIKAEYERLLSAMAAAPKSPNKSVGVWISGFSGSGKSSFAKNLGYALANREVHGTPASSLFLKQVESKRVTECVEFLNRAVPYEIFMCDVQAEPPAGTNAKQIAEVIYQVLLRELDYAEDFDISELEIELEKGGKLAAFENLCRAEYNEEWRTTRKDSRKVACASALLHRLDPQTYASTDTWLNMVQARPSGRLSVKDLVDRSFDLCDVRRHGKAFAFILDEMSQFGERLENLLAVVERFGKESRERLSAGKIPGPVWIVVTARQNLEEIHNYLVANCIDLPKPQDRFRHQIDLSSAGIREVVTGRVLRKKASQEFILKELYRDRGALLMQNVKLERCSRCTEFDEDQFVQSYPYLPHLIDLSVDIMAGMHVQPNSSKYLDSSNRSIVKQSFEMITSDLTGLADQPIGVLVSIDKIYELVEGNTPWEKRKDILDIRQRYDDDKDYPGMASRVAKAICLMEFAKTDLPRTTKNIAALLVQRVTEAPPTLAVAGILDRLKGAQFVSETKDGWKLYDFDELRRTATALGWLGKWVGGVTPRKPGWHNGLLQLVKKLLARSLNWYTWPLRQFNDSVSRSLQETVGALDHLSMNMIALDRHSMNMDALDRRIPADRRGPQLLDHISMNIVALDRLSMDMVALEGRLAQLEKRSANLAESIGERLDLLQEQVERLAGLQTTANPDASAGRRIMDWGKRAPESSPFYADRHVGSDRTVYVIGLFGTGRRYINELMLENIGERAKYFRDTIRLHPGPTPMIYSGHATMRYVSRAQELPAVMSRILEAVRSGFATLIFVYRHPLDSLLTNWIWWRTYIRENRLISGISQVYKNTDDLCADLEQDFLEFKAFAEGDPDFFAGIPGPPFLSFPEFVEETELHFQSATLTLRLEDFMIDPSKEFSKIVEVMSVDLDQSRLCIAPPRTKPYGYLAVKDKVPRFRNFIDGLNAETKRRIETIGYKSGD